jgi:hypothetical protein
MQWLIRAAVLAGFLMPALASAGVLHSKQSAFEAAFPAGAEVVQTNLYLTAEDAAFISAQSGMPWAQRLANVYVAKVAGKVVAYGYFDTHRVRTLNQTVLVVVRPDGQLHRVLQVAFHEPAEYQAPARWLAQFMGRSLDANLSLKTGIDGLSGATLTARSLTVHVRATLALHQRMVAPKAS